MSIFGDNPSRFIVIEGTDGSGKTTQLSELLNYAQENGIPTHILDFPQYKEFWGRTVGKFLDGQFGNFEDTSPYLVQPLYMLDQASRGPSIRQALAEGKLVLSNRYLTSSMAHQTARFNSPAEQQEFLEWVQEAGYTHLNMPKPDLVIVLYVPPVISYQLARDAQQRKTNAYSEKDIAEENLEHQEKSAYMYQTLCNTYPEWVLIQCIDEEGNLLDIKSIHQLVKETISRYFES